MIPIYLTSVNNINFMKIFALKLVNLDGDKPESLNFLVKAETYGRAEAMGYEIANEFGWKTFSLESVVKKQIKEIHESVQGECTMWLVEYEFGLEAKPEKSNCLYAGKFITDVTDKATKHLGEYCDSLFIKGVKHMDFQEYLDDSVVEESFEESLDKKLNELKDGGKVTFSMKVIKKEEEVEEDFEL